MCIDIQRIHYCVVWKKNRRDNLPNGVKVTERNFNFAKIKMNVTQPSQRLRYSFPKHETTDQLDNVFVFDLETCTDQVFAEAYASGFYDE